MEIAVGKPEFWAGTAVWRNCWSNWLGVWLDVVACTSWENSDVSPLGSVAVALIHCPARLPAARSAANVTLPLASVVTVVEPSQVWPWP